MVLSYINNATVGSFMCDVCKSKGIETEVLNGDKTFSSSTALRKVFVGKVVEVKLCYVHDIELFKLGERRFIAENLQVMPILWRNNTFKAA